MGSRAIESRFWAKVEKTDTCWLWTAYVRRDGYGTFGVSGQKLMAHRVSYECLTGSIPSGLQLDHLCRVRHCVNPAHLEPVTLQINISRGLAGAHQRIKTHCPQGHQYNEENTYHYADGSRHCRTCQRDVHPTGPMPCGEEEFGRTINTGSYLRCGPRAACGVR